MKNLTIYCKDFELTDAIKSYVEEKMTSLLRYFGDNTDEVSYNFRLGKVANNREKGKIFYAEVSIHTPEKNYGGRIEAEDAYVAIDLLRDELSGNITQYKDKSLTLQRKDALKFKEELHRGE